MPKIRYVVHKFGSSATEVINQANSIIGEYRSKGFRLTLRQTFYQFVARGLIPNTLRSYKRLGGIINDARLAGLIDWSAIEDRTRETVIPPAWSSPADIIEAAARSYQEDLWADQDNRVEVHVEKEALAGVVESVCRKLNIPFLSCRGYTSQSEMWQSAMRLVDLERKQHTVVLHLGDHDPSGIDMTRDIEQRLQMFGSSMELIRIALNMDQIEEYSPPPNPAKVTDSRFDAYQQKFGMESWELDALEPSVLVDLIEMHAKKYRDEDRWNAAVDGQERRRRLLQLASDRWDDVVSYLNDGE